MAYRHTYSYCLKIIIQILNTTVLEWRTQAGGRGVKGVITLYNELLLQTSHPNLVCATAVLYLDYNIIIISIIYCK